MKRLWTVVAVLVVGGLVAGAGYLGFAGSRSGDPGAPAAPLTVAVAVCDVQQTVTAPGSTLNTRTVKLEMPSAGQLAEVRVRAGDVVTAGQVLARLAHRETYAAAVAAAELELAQAQQALDEVHANAPLEAAQAQLAYVQAQKDLATAQRTLAGLLSPDVAYYQQQVDRGQDDLDLAQKNAALTDLASAVRQAQEALDDATSALNDVKTLNARYPGGFTERLERAQRTYEGALDNFHNATLRYEQAQINNTHAVEDAQASLAEAQRRLAAAQAGPNAPQVALAQAQVAVKQAQLAQAQSDWESRQNGPDPLEVSAAQARVDTALAALAGARQALEQVEIKAPFAGVVLEVDAPVGETLPAATALFTLADPQALAVKANLTQDDYPLLTQGQSAEVYFDARPEVTAHGHVDRLIPKLVSGASPTYDIIVSLDQVPAELVEGMTADTNITIASRAGVLCLPRSVVRASSDNTAVVQVWNGSATEARSVTTGLRGDSNVEILSGLAAGEQVVVR